MTAPLNDDNFYTLLNRFSTSELENMVKQYPYLHQAHLLLAKKYQVEKNPAFDEQLQLAALYAQDRELFYSLFNEKQPTTPFVSPVDQEIIANTVTPKEVEAESEELPTPQTEVLTHSSAPTEAEPTFHLADEHTFEEWLRFFPVTQASASTTALPAAITDTATSETTETDELERMMKANISVDYLHELVAEETHYSRGLDEFIQQQINKRKLADTKLQSHENEMDPDLATETLAKLYQGQKRYAKAIKTYELLTLKFPEKSDFFAARINYLKSLI